MGFDDTKKRALRMLEKRDYARGEMISKLRQKGIDESEATEVADYLVELGLINDEKFAGMVVRHYAAKGFGEARVRDELRRRYLPRELWDEALSEMPEQDDTIDMLLRQKLRSDDPDRDELRRATAALTRRGFSWSDIRAAVERFNAERCCD